MLIAKKFGYTLTSILAAGTLLLTGCSSSSDTTANNAASKEENTEKITIRFGHGAAEDNSRHKAALKFKELAEEKSNGQIEVQVFPGEQLGSEPAMLQGVQGNTIQMTAVGTGIYAKNHKEIGVVELPYVFSEFEQAWNVLDGPLGKELSDPLIEQDIRVLSYWENGFRQVTNNKKPIKTPEDLKGLKIRTPEIPVSISVFKALGANPTPMSFGELFQALEQGIVDGQENPMTNIYFSKIYEVQKYMSLTKHQYSPLPLAVSEKFWKTLPEDQQKIIQESATEAGQYHRDLVKEDDAKLKKELEKHGMKVNELDTKPFEEAVKPVYKEYEKEYGKELIDNLRNAAEEAK